VNPSCYLDCGGYPPQSNAFFIIFHIYIFKMRMGETSLYVYFYDLEVIIHEEETIQG
jgi:hypothetical protein